MMLQLSKRALQLRRIGLVGSMPISRSLFAEVQSGLLAFQELTQLPWWISLSLSTIVVKTSLLPLVRYQIVSSENFSKVAPEMITLGRLLKQNLSPQSGNTVTQKANAVKSFTKGFMAAMKIHDVSLLPVIIPPIVNASVFITFVWSVRDMLYSDQTGVLLTGGTMWFENLTVADTTLILPVVGMASSYLALEMAFRNGTGPYVRVFQDFVQCVVILALPMTSSLPAGVFLYWIPSSLYGMMQSRMLRNPAVRKFLRIPEKAKPASSLTVP